MEKQQVFYIHGAEAYSNYNAFLRDLQTMPIYDLPWTQKPKRWSHTFRDDLTDTCEVFTPSMPNKQNAKYEEWKIWFERHFEYLRDDVILIGWSQGGYFLVKYLLENSPPFTIRALVLLAAPFKNIESQNGEDGGDFAFEPARLPELATRVEKIFILHSTDDPIVPYAHALKYKEALPEAELITFEDKNHFLVEELPELVELVREVAGIQ